jgi:PRTRC genetic system protein E
MAIYCCHLEGDCMFQELMPVIKNRRLTITVASVAGGKIRVCVVPQSEEKDDKINDKVRHQSEVAKIPDAAIKALTTPLALTGTPEELDRELGEKLAAYAGSHEQLQDGLAQASQEITDALTAIEERKKEKAKGKTPTAAKNDTKEEKTKGKTPAAETAPPTAVSASDAAAGDRDTHQKEEK